MKNILTFFLLVLFSMPQIVVAESSGLFSKIKLNDLLVSSVYGSMSPYISTSDSGITTINWLEPSDSGYAIKFAKYNNTWDEHKIVAQGNNWFINWADFPSLIHMNDDNYAAHWLIKSSSDRYAYDTQASISKDGGDTWSNPIIVNQDGTPTEHGFASLYRDGDNLGLIYLDGRKMINEMTADPNDTGMTLRATSINLETKIISEQLIDGLVCECCQTNIAKSSQGPIGIYRNRTEDEIRDIYITKKINGKWMPGKLLHKDDWNISGCPVNGPSIHADINNVSVGWFTAANDNPVIKLTKSSDHGNTFSTPYEIGLNSAVGHVNITVDRNDNTWMIWHKKISNGAVALMLSMLEDKTNQLSEMIIDETGNIPRYSVPQITNHNDEIIMAWTIKVNSETSGRGRNTQTFIKSASFKINQF